MIESTCGRTATGRRTFPIAYRIEFLRAWDEAVEFGAKAKLLREHKLASTTVDRWIRARDEGQFTTAMVATADKSRSKVDSRDRAELARLRTENAALKKKVAQGEAVQDILGKAYELLEGITTSSQTEEPQIPPSLMSATEYAHWLGRNKLS